MHPIKIELSSDRPQARLSLGEATVEVTAQDIDRLIRDLANVRARMTPVHPAIVPEEPERVHRSDNLLWSVRAEPAHSAIRFATHHPGLGWTAMWLSRAQIEDLVTSFEFELAKIPENR